MRRADLNHAREQWLNIALTPGTKPPKKIDTLIPQYGNKGKTLSDQQIEEALSWGKP